MVSEVNLDLCGPLLEWEGSETNWKNDFLEIQKNFFSSFLKCIQK